MKLAIVHDFLNQYGGAERVVETFHEIFPEAPIYTSIYIPENMPASFATMDIRTSFMQQLPFLKKHFKKYLMLYPRAIESFNLDEYDVLLTSSSSFAKAARKRQGACSICYCYAPMRFVWNYDHYMEKEELGKLTKVILPLFLRRLKSWDLTTNRVVDHFVSISKHIQKRISQYYGRESVVIYPPVNTSNFAISDKCDDYFLIVSRLNAYKKIDLVIEAFNRLALPLHIVGDGPYKESLQRIAAENITFLGKLPDKELGDMYSKCRAFIFPGIEDFGIAPVEAQAAGRPVIAFAAGGALETVIEGKTGVFFHEHNLQSIIDAVNRLTEINTRFNPPEIRRHALQFDKEVFKEKIAQYISKHVS